MQNIQVLHLWQLDLTILTAQISRSSVERTGVCGCQSSFTALIASNSNSKHTRKTLTDFGLTGTSLRHLDRHLTLWDGRRKKLHSIVRSRTVTWLTRWRLPLWSQLNSGIFFLTNATRKHATMLDGTNRPFVRGIHWSPVNSLRGALMFSLICAWLNGWVNNHEAGDLRCYRAYHDVTVISNSFMEVRLCILTQISLNFLTSEFSNSQWADIGSDNGSSRGQILRNIFLLDFNENTMIFIQVNEIEDVTRKLLIILVRPRWIKSRLHEHPSSLFRFKLVLYYDTCIT